MAFGLLLLAAIFSLADRPVRAEDSLSAADTTGADTGARVPARPPSLRPLIYTMEVSGAITVVTTERIIDALEQAEENNAELLVILLDTPGGYVEATRTINKAILNSSVPVCMYVHPQGARAGSAGVYMCYAANFAAMAPSTNIGAAHPVGGAGQQPDSIMNEKITNDAVAQIRALAEKRGRNAEWAEKAVRESVSITETMALDSNVINVIASDLDELLKQLHGQETEVIFGKTTLDLEDAIVEEIHSTFLQRVRQAITDPNVIFILFSIGSLGIVIELWNPGAILPGVVGAISLILGFYATQSLPVNYAALLLILLAIVLFILEVKIVSYGMLTVGGLVSLFLGGLLLIDTVNPVLQVSLTVLITVVVLVGIIAFAVGWLVIKAHRRSPATGQEGMVGKVAEVRQGGFVYVDGALWKAEFEEELAPGTRVEVVGSDKLVLKVRKLNS
jgi:membrane-bound serine protease (ClpP class)